MNTFLKFLAPAVSLAATFVLSTSANAVFQIDDFSNPYFTLPDRIADANAAEYLSLSSSALLGNRYALVSLQSTTPGAAAVARVENGWHGTAPGNGGGTFLMSYGFRPNFQYGPTGSSSLSIGWYSNTNMNFSSVSSLQFNIRSAPAGTRVQARFSGRNGIFQSSFLRASTLISSTISTETAVSINLLTPTSSSAPAAIALADVDYIDLLIFLPTSGGTFDVRNVEAVPEPGTILVLAAGTAALARRRRSA